jgi:hypothetical protein
VGESGGRCGGDIQTETTSNIAWDIVCSKETALKVAFPASVTAICLLGTVNEKTP